MRDTVEFKQDAAGLHPRNPEFRRTLARAHADLGRLRRDGHIGEDADPQAALPLDVTGDRTARGLDLPGGEDRKSVVSGKSVSVRVDLGGRRIIKKKQVRNIKTVRNE